MKLSRRCRKSLSRDSRPEGWLRVRLAGVTLDSVYVCTYDLNVPVEVPDWTWDPQKARANRRKHGVSFAEALIALEDPLALTIPDRTRDEERLVTIGLNAEGTLIVVAWSPLEQGGRILSARKATPRERRSYEEKP
jgi:uncharacterized protein